jgi:uncharacterized membrane protein YraQ (UPF0718 family)
MRAWMLTGAGLAAWALVYSRLETFASWLAHSALGLPRDSHAGAAMEFFAYDAPKILLLLALVSFGVGVLRSFLSPSRMRALLAGRRQFVGNVLAAGLGVLTPFCSCSAVSLFVGLVSAGVPLGVTFSFLIAAPMVNEVALALLLATFGWKVAGLYLSTGLAVAIGAGWVLGRLRLENHVEEWARVAADAEPTASGRLDWPARLGQGWAVMRDVLNRAWLWILLGIAVGAGIHGYVPEQALASVLGRQAWWSVPLAVALGVPMYANAAGVIPIMQALLGKGAALGTTLAFIMAVVALSLPEALLLRQVLKPRLIAVFFGIVAAGILGVGWLFNFFF